MIWDDRSASFSTNSPYLFSSLFWAYVCLCSSISFHSFHLTASYFCLYFHLSYYIYSLFFYLSSSFASLASSICKKCDISWVTCWLLWFWVSFWIIMFGTVAAGYLSLLAMMFGWLYYGSWYWGRRFYSGLTSFLFEDSSLCIGLLNWVSSQLFEVNNKSIDLSEWILFSSISQNPHMKHFL